MIGPEKYNQLYSKIGNLNRLLAWAHAKIENLINDAASAGVVLIDSFANEGTMKQRYQESSRVPITTSGQRLNQIQRSVPQASSRAAFLRGIGALSRRFDVKLPLGGGASTLSSGRQIIELHGRSALGQVAKLHFANTGKIDASI